MRQERGFSLIEVLVAAVILVIVVGGAAVSYVSIRKLSKEMDYRYTALNLAREILEFGEAGRFGHELSMKYYYPKTQSPCTVEIFSDCGGAAWPCNHCCASGAGCGYDNIEKYGIKECWCFCPQYPDPFDYLGDIKARGLVPKGAPDSVVIYYKAERDPGFYNAYKETVEITWQEEPEGKIKKEVLSVIPIRQVNNQLRLTTAEFWWE